MRNLFDRLMIGDGTEEQQLVLPSSREPASETIQNQDMEQAKGLQVGYPGAEVNLLRQMISKQRDEVNQPSMPIDFSGNTVGTLDNLRLAQEKANENRGLINLSRALGQVSEGLVGVGGGQAKVSKDLPDALEKQADLPVQQLRQQMEQENTDPNSPKSKGLRDMIQKEFGIQIKGNPSYTDLQKAMPQLVNLYNAREARQQRMDELQLRLASQQDIARERAQQRKDELDLKKRLAMTPGEQATDKTFAKDYVEWESGGKSSVDKNLNLLEQTIETLRKREKDLAGTSGRVTGRLPDFLRSEESIRLREDVHRAAQESLKATLGAQFTEKEGERIMNQAYNEKLSPEENIKKIEATIKELKARKQAKDNMSDYFNQQGSLKGYKGEIPASSSATASPSEVRRKTSDGRTAVFNANTKEFIRYE